MLTYDLQNLTPVPGKSLYALHVENLLQNKDPSKSQREEDPAQPSPKVASKGMQSYTDCSNRALQGQSYTDCINRALQGQSYTDCSNRALQEQSYTDCSNRALQGQSYTDCSNRALQEHSYIDSSNSALQ